MKAFKITFILLIILLSLPACTMAYSATYCKFIKGDDDFTQFHIAACKGNVEAVKKFIEKGININKVFSVTAPLRGINERYEFNALHTALWQYRESNNNKDNYRQVIELLVNNGIDADYPFRHTKKQAKLDSPHNEMAESRPISFAPNNEIGALLRKGGAKKSSLIFTKQEDEFNYFQGDIIVSGEIYINPYDEFNAGMLCMVVDKETSYLIPRAGDTRVAWFCLECNESLYAKMKIDRKKIKDNCFTGFAKIKITNYRQYINESEGCDFARLVKLIEMNNYIYKKCQRNE